MSEPALLPCPFCGSTSVEFYTGRTSAMFREPSICCEDCGIGFTQGVFGIGVSADDAKSETVEAWNRRAHHTNLIQTSQPLENQPSETAWDAVLEIR